VTGIKKDQPSFQTLRRRGYFLLFEPLYM